MIGRLRLASVAFLAAALVSLPALATSADAQEASERFRVLVPRLLPAEDEDDGFGEDFAEEFRDLVNDLATHRPVEEDEIEDAMDEFDMDWEDLDCIRARQLASQITSQVVVCGEYSDVGNDQYEVNAQFVVVDSNDNFEVDPFTVDEGAREEAAQQVLDAFDRVVEQTRAAAFCQDYYSSEQYESALENCTRAVELNPESVQARYTRALTLENLDRLQDAMEELERVLEQDPVHENALQWAGNIAARLDRSDEGREYYQRYLELNPGDSSVRMRIAYDLAQAGDPVGAMQLIEEGFDLDEDNPNLYEQYGNFAFTAATQAMEEEGLEAQAGQATGAASDEIPERVAEYYRTAIDAYERVFEMRGDSTSADQLRNVVAARLQLDQTDEAVSFAEEALDAHPESARLWSIYADALNRSDQIDEAIAALDSVQEIDPDYANVSVRQGQWLLREGRIDDALPRLQAAVERGEQSADVVARLILADAHSNGIQQDNYDRALRGLQAAKEFDVGENVRAELDFWHGYALYQQAVAQQEPQTVETAEATLPQFQRAMELFQASESYANQQSSIPLDKFLEGTQTYIEIQEAIIERGSRGG